MTLSCPSCRSAVDIPPSAVDGFMYDCPACGAPLRFRSDPSRLELIPRARCPESGELVPIMDDVRNGEDMIFRCGHRHRVTYESGTWGLA